MSLLWTRSGFYPPFTFIVGSIATFIGGVNADSPVIGENVVYVSLLALGCYQTSRLLADARAGFLAVVFALGSPLLIEQFHVFMIDAPEASIVAVSVWLILASDRFERVGTAALAGLAVGIGIASKESFPIFIAGLCALVVLRGRGWRNWRGMIVFGVAALVVGAPWYIINFSQLGQYAEAGLAPSDIPARGRPPLLSVANLGWYLWAVMNGLLFAPLSAFAAVGVGQAAARALRRTHRHLVTANLEVELLGGLFVAWLGITLTPHHDMRYAMGLIVYLAALGTVWITRLSRNLRFAAILALVLAVSATTIGATLGVGGEIRILLASHPISVDSSWGIAPPGQITIYSDHDFVIAAPRDDRIWRLFGALRREGYTGVGWIQTQAPLGDSGFDLQGLELFARFAGLAAPEVDLLTPWDMSNPRHVLLGHFTLAGRSPPCIVLHDGTGVWVKAKDRPVFCPR